MKIVCRKVGRSLVPVDDEGFDALAKVKDGRDVKVEFTMSRNLRHHRLMFQVFRFVQDHSPVMAKQSIEDIKDAIKLATGHVRRFVDAETGATAYVTKSLAFEAMDQLEFNRFFDDACQVISNRWMPAGTTPESVRDELIILVDGEHSLNERAS